MIRSMRANPALPGLFLAAMTASTMGRADVPAGVDAWTKGNYAAAVREWQEPASKGDADALFNLGQAYKLGRGVGQDMARAEDLFRQASAAGHLQAADTYGLLLFQRGEREKALPYIQAAAERGDPRAQYLLGIAHFNGDLVEKDWARAYALATMAQHAGLQQAALAVQQMDAHISLAERQLAATIAADLGERITASRARQLAAAELGASAVSAPTSGPSTPQATTSEPPTRTRGPDLAGADYARPGRQVATPGPAPATGSTASAAAGANRPWRLQLGAFSQPANLEALWARIRGRPELAGRPRLLVPAGRATKLLATGFATQAEAQSACSKLTAAGFACLPVRN